MAIFDVLTRQDGLELPSMEEQREEDVLRVEDAMQVQTEKTILEADDTLALVAQRIDFQSTAPVLVRLHPAGWSSITAQELEMMLKEGKSELTLSSVLASRRIPHLHPDQPLEVALRYVDRWPLLPVVSRADFRKLEGVISQHNVLERYREFGEA